MATVTPARAAVHRLALARMISIGGSAAAYTALLFTVYDRTGSAGWISAALLATDGVTAILGPVGSVLGDRLDRRRVMIASELAGAACFAGMSMVGSPAALVAVALASAVAEAPFWPASGAAIPNLVPPEQVSWANSLVAVGRNVGITVGPALGGALVAVLGPSWVFAINAASFVVSAALIASVRASFSRERTGEREPHPIRAGFRFLFGDRVLRKLAVAWVTLMLGIGMVLVADVPLAELFGTGAVGYGAMITLWGAGSVLGSLAGRWLRPQTEIRWLALSLAFVAATGFGIATAPWFWVVLALNLAWGVGEGIGTVADQNIMQRRTPDAVRSRVMGASEGMVHGTMFVAYPAAAFLVPALGPRGVYAIAGVAGVFAVLVLLPLVRLASSEIDPGSERLGPVAPDPCTSE
jgi:MFS family permease